MSRKIMLYPVSHANFTPLKFVQHRPRTTAASPAIESGHDIIVRAWNRTACAPLIRSAEPLPICAYARGRQRTPKARNDKRVIFGTCGGWVGTVGTLTRPEADRMVVRGGDEEMPKQLGRQVESCAGESVARGEICGQCGTEAESASVLANAVCDAAEVEMLWRKPKRE